MGIAGVGVATTLATAVAHFGETVGDALALVAKGLAGILLVAGLRVAVLPAWRRRNCGDPGAS